MSSSKKSPKSQPQLFATTDASGTPDMFAESFGQAPVQVRVCDRVGCVLTAPHQHETGGR